MRRFVWFAAAALATAVLALSLVALPRGSEWTTTSDAAREEFLAAMQAQMKVYGRDAALHFERAMELDPDFLLAKLQYLEYARGRDAERADELVEELLAADLGGLHPREQLLVERFRALHDGRSEDAEQLVDEYLAKHHDDPFVLHIKATEAWKRGELDRAERINQRLAELSPNWVVVYNQLGYITMMQERFTEAREYFVSYRFVAPDQANPHDSLGELYLIQGQYRDAIDSFERAIAIRPDFWASYEDLVIANSMIGDLDAARRVVDRAAAVQDAPEDLIEALRCVITFADLEDREAWHEALASRDSPCVSSKNALYPAIVIHRAACKLGMMDVATATEDALRKMVEMLGEAHKKSSLEDRGRIARATLLQLEAERVALQGELVTAEKLLRKVDASLRFLGGGEGIFKLWSRAMLVEVLLAQGRDAEAHQALSDLRFVNPEIALEFEENGLQIIGLPRGSAR